MSEVAVLQILCVQSIDEYISFNKFCIVLIEEQVFRLVKTFVLEYVIPYFLTILANGSQKNCSKLHIVFLPKNKVQLCDHLL